MRIEEKINETESKYKGDHENSKIKTEKLVYEKIQEERKFNSYLNVRDNFILNLENGNMDRPNVMHALLNGEDIKQYLLKLSTINDETHTEENRRRVMESKLDSLQLKKSYVQSKIKNLVKIEEKINKAELKYNGDHESSKSKKERLDCEKEQEEIKFNSYLDTRDDFISNLEDGNTNKPNMDCLVFPDFTTDGSFLDYIGPNILKIKNDEKKN